LLPKVGRLLGKNNERFILNMSKILSLRVLDTGIAIGMGPDYEQTVETSRQRTPSLKKAKKRRTL
jgi:hypothetical protein